MAFLTDDRAQALQVGAVLLFGILVILFTVWQAFVIPDANERVEFTHNQDVQSEMVELRSTVITTGDAATPQSSSVSLGTQFPPRLLFVNPSPATGTLRTTTLGDGQVSIYNAMAIDDQTAGFWNGTERSYTSRSIEYAPDYRVFQGAPRTVYDNSILYNVFDLEDGNTSAVSEQSLIDGNTISLVMLGGSYDETRIGAVTPDVQPISTQSSNVEIQPPDDGNITISVPSQLSAQEWREAVGLDPTDPDDLTLDGVAVRANSTLNETIDIILTNNETRYELDLAKVGLGTGIANPEPGYMVEDSNVDGSQVSTDRNHTIVVETRDEFNTPLGGIQVDVSDITVVGPGGDEDDVEIQANRTSDTNGLAAFDLDLSGLRGDAADVSEVQIEFEGDRIDPTLTVSAEPFDPDEGPQPEFEVEWDDSASGCETHGEDDTMVCTDINEGDTFELIAVAPDEDDDISATAQFAILDNDIIEFDDEQFAEFDNQPRQNTANIDLEAENEGVTEIIVFAGGDSDRAEIIVGESGSISGTVFDSNGNPGVTPPVDVVVTDGPVDRSAQALPADGSYTLSDLPPGTYTFSVNEAGYTPTEQTVTITAGEDVTGQDFQED